MPKNNPNRQEKLLKKRRKQKEKKKQAARNAASSSDNAVIRRANRYPICHCYMSEKFEEEKFGVVFIGRRQNDGLYVVGVYMVDIGCLGVKNTFARANLPEREYEEDFLGRILRDYEMVKADPTRAQLVVYGAVDYAKELGFKPQRDFVLARHVLDAREDLPSDDSLEFGCDGKPFYVAGPHDNVDKIMQQLQSRLPKDGFHFIVPVELEGDEAWLP